MSTLTSNDVYGLMEAYQAVYAPQELTEEQVWEEVETWVNSLLEEGYDLSDYTWEEMFEAYIEEQGGRRGAAVGNPNVYKPAPQSKPQVAGGGMGGMRGSGRDRNASQTSSSPGALRVPGPVGPKLVGPKIVGPKIVGPKIVGPKIVGPGSSTSTRPPAAAPAKPAGTAPSPKTSATTTPAPATTTPAPATPSAPARPSLSSQVDDLKKMRARSLERQGKPLSAATVASSTTPAFQANSFDLFDVVIGHLLDEGYADTEEAALVIMSNMSEEWRDSIIEEVISEGEKPFPHEKVKRKQESLRGKGGKSIDRTIAMGLARRRAKEAEKTGGSQQDAGKGWYHGR